MTYIAVFFISLFLTIFFTPYLISYLKKEGILDRPEERKVHKESTPRMGGLIVFVVMMIVIFSFYSDLNSIRFLIIGLILITICGVVDDIVGLRWLIKFIFQFLSAISMIVFLMPYFNNVTLFGIVLPKYFDIGLLFLFIVGVINSINLMDGMDGLVSGFSLMVLIIVMALSSFKIDPLVLLISVSVAGALFGFLKFNAFPARIFLGDTGSLFLGFILVLLALKVSIKYNNGNLSMGFPILLLAVPILDTLKVMAKRISQKKNPFLPDNNHLHHVIFYSRVRHKTTVFLIQIFALTFFAIALYYLRTKSLWVLPLFILLSLALGYSHFIFNKLKISNLFKQQYEFLIRVPSLIIQNYMNYLVVLSGIAVVIILFSSIKVNNSNYSLNEISFLIVSGLLMFILSLAHNRKSATVNHIYFYINIVVFFFITHFNNFQNVSKLIFPGNVILLVSYIVLSSVIILFLIARERFIPQEEILLTGIDLTMIVVIALGFIVVNFLQSEISILISESLLVGFLMYVWYKMLTYIKPKIILLMYYGSFFIPIIYLIALLLQ